MEHIDYKKVLSSDFCESIFDGTHDSPKYVESGYPLVTSKYIFGSKIDYLSAPQISKTDYDLINKRSKVKLFDVLVSMIGINAGIVALVDNEPQYAIKNVGAFRCKNEINAKYLYYYLQSFKGQYMLKNSMTGSAQPYISLERLRTLQFSIPEERIQRHIVNIVRWSQ